MILERLQGHSPTKVCKQSSFADVHYLEEFLFCLFNSLDIGQKALGFHHAGEAFAHPQPCRIDLAVCQYQDSSLTRVVHEVATSDELVSTALCRLAAAITCRQILIS